jgi:hypothetical protein
MGKLEAWHAKIPICSMVRNAIYAKYEVSLLAH